MYFSMSEKIPCKLTFQFIAVEHNFYVDNGYKRKQEIYICNSTSRQGKVFPLSFKDYFYPCIYKFAYEGEAQRGEGT